MRATFAVAAFAAVAAAQSYGPITQISDGQIQNPVTPAPIPSAVSSPAAPSVEASSTPVVVVSTPAAPTSVYVPVPPAGTGTGGASAPAGSTGIYQNSTLATSATISSPVGGSSAPAGSASASATSAVPTGAAAVQQVGAFGFIAALAAVFLA